MPEPEPVDHDDFDEPGVDALLRRHAAGVAHPEETSDSVRAPMRDNIFQPPEDLSELYRRLREVDRRLELEVSARRPPSVRRLYPVLAAAAVLGLAVGIYFYAQPERGPSPVTRIAMVPVGATRGQTQDGFRLGDKVRLEATVSQPARAYVALLDSTGHLSALEDQVYPLEPGKTNQLPPGDKSYELGDRPGTESFLILTTEASLDASDLRAIVEATARNLRPEGKSHELLLPETLAALRRDARIDAAGYTYQLRPDSP